MASLLVGEGVQTPVQYLYVVPAISKPFRLKLKLLGDAPRVGWDNPKVSLS